MTIGGINIKIGNGNGTILVSGGNVNVDTGNGDHNIGINASGDLNIDTGCFGKDTVIATGNFGNINTHDDDDAIQFTGDSFNISAIGGNNTILAKGNLENTTNANAITVGDGTSNQVVGVANNLAVSAGNTGLTAVTVGDNLDLNAGDGTHVFAFWGDGANINAGNGDAMVETLNNSFERGAFTNLGLQQYVDADTTTTTATSTRTYQNITSDMDLDALADKYNLSDSERKILNSVDLSAKYSDGGPLYVIEKSPKKSKAAGHDVYVIGRRDGAKHTRAVSDNECIATRSDWTNEGAGVKTIENIKETTTTTTTTVNGVNNVNINLGSGSQLFTDLTMTTNKAANNLTFNTGDFTTHSINVEDGSVKTDINVQKDVLSRFQSIISTWSSGNTYNSPLVVDFNQDGKVSAAAGKGVDIDNNGTADGAAVDGDKMLAMSDMNGNGKIDGSEVFGDQTVNPFTGEKMNAANGFEALKQVAESAEQYTGKSCMDADGNVDLQALKEALATVGVNLGFISDDNVTELEDLTKISKINVNNYAEQNQTGDVQHRQLGSLTYDDGTQGKVNDVWFKLQ